MDGKEKSKRIGGSAFCGAYNCNHSFYKEKSKGKSFFRFPKDEERCRVWVQNSRRVDLIGLTGVNIFRKGVKLCSDHFESNQFNIPSERKRLVWNAVRTLFDVPNPTPSVTPERKCPTRISLSGVPNKKQKVKLKENQFLPNSGDCSEISEVSDDTQMKHSNWDQKQSMDENLLLDIKQDFQLLSTDQRSDFQALTSDIKEEFENSSFNENTCTSSKSEDSSIELKPIPFETESFYDDTSNKATAVLIPFQQLNPHQIKQEKLLSGQEAYDSSYKIEETVEREFALSRNVKIESDLAVEDAVGCVGSNAGQGTKESLFVESGVSDIAEREEQACFAALRVKVEASSLYPP